MTLGPDHYRSLRAWGTNDRVSSVHEPQLWPDKANEGAMRQTLPTDGHPPGVYRRATPSQHAPAFYDAFGIRPGDRRWLDPQQGVSIW